MEKFRQECLCGCIGGFSLHIVESLCSILPYINVSNLLFDIWLITCIVLGCVIAIFVLLYGKATLTKMIFRCVVVFASYICLWIMSVYIEITSFVFEVCNIPTSTVQDNVSGLIMISFWAIIVCVCIVTIIVAAIGKLFKKRCK